MSKNENLYRFRISFGLTLREMADEIGVSKSYYEKIEAGIRNPSYNFIEKFKSKYRDVDTDSLFFSKNVNKNCNRERYN